ncbi:unannotated protein [freshwater metagenome]|uniref:Unannotated protein n=1 Tax=freshwater metagenome TaxID=449393 RepID=A0A6J7IKT1_9ZZZZ
MSPLRSNNSGPGCMPYCWNAANMMAAVADVGSPSASSAPIAVPAVEFPAASGPATPRMAPLPNIGFSRLRSSLRSVPYARKLGTSAPPAGMTPNGTPNAVPRSQAGSASRNSALLSQGRPCDLINDRSSGRPIFEAMWMTSPSASIATVITTM